MLTYIDPNDNSFGVLGYEIVNDINGKPLDIKDGSIYESNIIGITPSEDGKIGEINAEVDQNKVKGKIERNTKEGIFGKYLDNIDLSNKLEVSNPSLGDGWIITS